MDLFDRQWATYRTVVDHDLMEHRQLTGAINTAIHAWLTGRDEGAGLPRMVDWTLVATDIATGWSESLPLLQRDGAVVLLALQLIRQQLPFPLRGIDADNDPVFTNTLMEAWCDRPEARIKLTRSRAYHSNDLAWVEQKTGYWCAGWWAISVWSAWRLPGCSVSCTPPCGCSRTCSSRRSS